jgi:hypothetical protein
MIDRGSVTSSALAFDTYPAPDVVMSVAQQIRRSESACLKPSRATLSRQPIRLRMSRGNVLQDDSVSCQIDHGALRSGVRRFQLPQTLCLVKPHTSLAHASARYACSVTPMCLVTWAIVYPLPTSTSVLGTLHDLLDRTSLLRHNPSLLFP